MSPQPMTRIERLARLRASRKGNPDEIVPIWEGSTIVGDRPFWKVFEKEAAEFIEDLEMVRD